MKHERIKRKHLIYYLRIFDRSTLKPLGRLVDINPDGIMVISENPIEPNITFHLRMKLPAEIFGKKHINFDAKSKWCKKDVNTSFYDSGFELLNAAIEDRKIITKLINDFELDDE